MSANSIVPQPISLVKHPYFLRFREYAGYATLLPRPVRRLSISVECACADSNAKQGNRLGADAPGTGWRSGALPLTQAGSPLSGSHGLIGTGSVSSRPTRSVAGVSYKAGETSEQVRESRRRGRCRCPQEEGSSGTSSSTLLASDARRERVRHYESSART